MFLIFFYNISPGYLKLHFTRVSSVHNYSTRGSSFNFAVPKSKGQAIDLPFILPMEQLGTLCQTRSKTPMILTCASSWWKSIWRVMVLKVYNLSLSLSLSLQHFLFSLAFCSLGVLFVFFASPPPFLRTPMEISFLGYPWCSIIVY